MVADPRAVAERWPDTRVRSLAALAIAVTETPWRVDRTLSVDEHVHAVMLSAYFGHLNRIADAVAVPLDYAVRDQPPHAVPTTPALAPAPGVRSLDIGPALARRPATGAAMTAWRDYVDERPARTSQRQRVLITEHAAGLVGFAPDRTPLADDAAVDHALVTLAELVTLAPWQLTEASYEPLRDAGYDDPALFDAVVVASTAGMLARIAVALASC